MQLDDQQKRSVRQWIEKGAGLSEVQNRLREEFGLSMTYMEVRFLFMDLGLGVHDKPTRAGVPSRAAPLPDAAEDEVGESAFGGEESAGAPGGVSVQVDRVMKPGSVLSGRVTFSDGVSASWVLDQMGRLALGSERRGYSPSQSDLAAFQAELRKTLESQGY